MKATAILVTLGLFIGFDQAFAGQENIASYENCAVLTERDDFTDKLQGHFILCAGGEEHFVLITCGNRNAVALNAGAITHLKDQIPIRYRWGQNPVADDIWHWNGTAAYTTDSDIADIFLDAVLVEDRLLYQVGDNQGTVNFTDVERAAVPDFQSRCSGDG